MKILGISAHYHDAAAALVDGRPAGGRGPGGAALAAQERRGLSHGRDRMVPGTGRPRARRSRRGRLLRTPDAEIRPHPDLRAARLSAFLALLPPRDEKHAGRKACGCAASSRPIWACRARKSCSPNITGPMPPPRSSPRRRGEAAILTADGVGEWATLTVGPGQARYRTGTDITLLREIRFPHSLGMLYSTFTAYLGFPVNEGEYKVMGLASYGRPTMADAVRKVVQRTPDGAFRLDLDYFDFHTSAKRSFSTRFVDMFGPPRDPYEPIDLETAGWPALCRLRRQRSAGPGGYPGGRGQVASPRDRPARSLPGRRRGAQRRRQPPHSAGIRLRADFRSPCPGRRGLRPGRGALCRPHSLRQSRSRISGPSVLGSDRAKRTNSPGWRGKIACRSGNMDDRS